MWSWKYIWDISTVHRRVSEWKPEYHYSQKPRTKLSPIPQPHSLTSIPKIIHLTPFAPHAKFCLLFLCKAFIYIFRVSWLGLLCSLFMEHFYYRLGVRNVALCKILYRTKVYLPVQCYSAMCLQHQAPMLSSPETLLPFSGLNDANIFNPLTVSPGCHRQHL